MFVLWMGLGSGLLRADPSDIAIFAQATAQGNVVTTLPVALTTGGQNGFLFVGVSQSASANTVLSVTWKVGATTQTLLRLRTQNIAGGCEMEMFGIVGPTAGAGTVTVTVSAVNDVVASAIDFVNVSQTLPVISQVSASGNSNAPTVNVTTANARDVIVDTLGADIAAGAASITAAGGANQNQLWNAATTTATGQGAVRAAGSDQTGADGVTMSWTLSAARNWVLGAITLHPANATYARYKRADAVQLADRVRVSWTTGLERDNLGFNVWREDATGRHKVSADLLAGSVLSVSTRTQHGARSYSCDDPGATGAAARYWIEDVDIHGVRTWYGPIAVTGDEQAVKTALKITPSSSLRNLGARSTRRTRRGGYGPLPGGTAMAFPASLTAALAPVAGTLAAQQALAARPAVKIRVASGGWYRVGRDELVAAGLPANAEPGRLRLHTEGREVAMSVSALPGQFKSGDYVEFFGTGQDTPYTDSRAYWLTWGDERGLRTGSAGKGLPLRSTPTETGFPFAIERADRSIYVATVHNGEADNFFGPVIMGTPVDQTIALPHPDGTAGRTATVTVNLQGFTDGQHAVAVALGGRPLGVMIFSNEESRSARYTVPSAWLADGDNTVRLTGSSDEDVTGVASIKIDYPHAFVADSDALLFQAQGGASYIVRGFTNNRLRLIDVTDPALPVDLRAEILADGAGFALSLAAPQRGPRVLLAFADSSTAAPAALTANQTSTWSARHNAGAFVMITRREFAAALEPLRARRAQELGSAVIVDVEDCYDEQSFGAKTPAAIRAFLDAARGWREPPQAVLLVGDATFDPRNFAQDSLSGPIDFDLVPTKIVDTTSFETASDDWFTDRDNDGVADLPVGRFPARTVDEVAVMVTRTLAYQDGPAGAWTRTAALVSDASSGPDDFAANALSGAAALPGTYAVDLIDAGALSVPGARSRVLAALSGNDGLVVYYGHASEEQWSDAGLLTGDDAAALPVSGRPSVIVAMTCLDGLFHDLFVDCLAKKFMRAPGGPAALWASTGFVEAGQQVALSRAFLAKATSGLTLGQAAVAAKRSITDRDARVTWTLFGDPTLKLR